MNPTGGQLAPVGGSGGMSMAAGGDPGGSSGVGGAPGGSDGTGGTGGMGGAGGEGSGHLPYHPNGSQPVVMMKGRFGLQGRSPTSMIKTGSSMPTHARVRPVWFVSTTASMEDQPITSCGYIVMIPGTTSPM